MRQADREETRNSDKGIGAGKAQTEEAQRDVQEDVEHMPRHWQSRGTRGQTSGQSPEPDDRDIARGNQYGRAGQLASEQVEGELSEHGQHPPPQRRDNDQLAKRPGERPEDRPTQDERD